MPTFISQHKFTSKYEQKLGYRLIVDDANSDDEIHHYLKYIVHKT